MAETLNAIVAGQLYAFLIIFARIGSAIFLMPGIGDSSLPTNIRLFIGLGLTLILTPVLSSFIPEQPEQFISYALLIMSEVFLGLFIALIAQAMMGGLHFAGFLISHATQLTNTFVFNPQLAAQSTIIGAFLSLVATVLLFITNLHHVLIFAMVNSYVLFVPGEPIIYGDFANMFAQTVNHSFKIGMEIAAPFVLISLTVYFAVGLIARLIPQIQIFFIMLPVKITVGFTTLLMTLSAFVMFFFEEFNLVMAYFIPS